MFRQCTTWDLKSVSREIICTLSPHTPWIKYFKMCITTINDRVANPMKVSQ